MSRRRTTKAPTTNAVPTKRRLETDTASQRDTKRVKARPTKVAKRTKPIKKRQSQAILNSVSTSRLHTFTFGTGSSGELGLGQYRDRTYRPTPNEMLNSDSVGIIGLAAGGMHAAAITHDNRIFTWGGNDDFALGRDTTFEMKMQDIDDADSDDSEDPELNPLEATPTAIPSRFFSSDVSFVQVVAGDSATFALTADGLVYGWGTFRDSNGKLAFSIDQSGQIIQIQRSPQLIPQLKDITQLSAGTNYVLALDTSGTVYSWGNNEQYQLGHRSLSRHRSLPLLPKLVSLPKKQIAFISAGAYHAFAIDKTGNVWAWGCNNFAQTGIRQNAGDDGAVVFPPQKVESLGTGQIKLIQGGKHHSVAVSYNGKCLAWGKIDDGRTGIDTKSLPLDDASILVEYNKPRVLLTPTALPISNCSFAAAGDDHSIALTSEGTAYSWGLNNSGQCGLGPNNYKRDPEEEVLTATVISCDALRGKRISWAGAGGQYSIIACETSPEPSEAHANGTS
ncbi:hypothetical protein LOZ52_005968 [Ophidiomyces ophidiicola]|nr:hypothetical protein LOZ64_004570 [Ophidiomyces ophidiicola]KAI2013879.1 hypothetical protein LOZ49_001680 [Ophidiomyces ophidiicola]KAI2018708.1 hypothetical protein LOZ46_003756 [Ophidiomyces ophidiicola]KAI2133325.1 hypothetical protein LOZ29_004707 [Ophidiomyces ophidiicola]KAI2146889.1 hypothetical protein LOZ28_000394 [Ophidiomyces ophidiicola]